MRYDIKYFENKFQDREPIVSEMKGRFSVLALFVYFNGEARLLFEVRADHLRRNSGEVCFPGGHIEPGESPEECAIRETAEELCVPERKLHIISELGYDYTYTGDMLHSFVGVIDWDQVDPNHVNRDEVKEIFTVPFSYLMEQGPQEAYDYESHYIWGLTARVVSRLVNACREL